MKFVPYQILHVELSQSIPSLENQPKDRNIFAVFCWHGIPLGDVEIDAAQLPMPAIAFYNLILPIITPAVSCHLLENPSRDKAVDFHAVVGLQQPLKSLQQRYEQPVSNSISIVVCTRNRPQDLARCLRSLCNLSQRPQQIIVVDNAPADETTRLVVSQFDGIEYILEPRPGLSVARNTGIRHSTGEIIAFTDDDAIAHPDWILRLQQGFNSPQVMGVTGLMLPAELETEAQLIFHRGSDDNYWGYRAITFDTQFFEERKHLGVPVWRIGAGVNMAFRRQIFELVGDFDERLGAGASGCSEDSEFWYRILASGWFCRYEPTAVVYHYHRSDIDALNHQAFQYMRGHVAALLVQYANYKHWGNIRRILVALPKYYTRRFLSELKKGFKTQHSTLFPEVLGCISGVKFYIKRKKEDGRSMKNA